MALWSCGNLHMDSLNSAAGKCPYRLQNALIDGATFLLHFLFEIGMKKGLQKVFIAPFLKKRRYRLCKFVYLRHFIGMVRPQEHWSWQAILQGSQEQTIWAGNWKINWQNLKIWTILIFGKIWKFGKILKIW